MSPSGQMSPGIAPGVPLRLHFRKLPQKTSVSIETSGEVEGERKKHAGRGAPVTKACKRAKNYAESVGVTWSPTLACASCLQDPKRKKKCLGDFFSLCVAIDSAQPSVEEITHEVRAYL
eukprot:41178-Prorocentrum_minimum.AAC.1